MCFFQHSAATAALGSLLFGRTLHAIINLVFAGNGGRLVVANVAIKTFEFRVITVYASNSAGERRSFFWWLGPFLDNSKRLVLVGDWNAILSPKIDRDEQGASVLVRCESCMIDLLAEFDLIDRFRLDHPGREMWTWLGDSPSGQIWIEC